MVTLISVVIASRGSGKYCYSGYTVCRGNGQSKVQSVCLQL